MPAAMPEVKNKRAAFEYFFLEQYECGLLLTGSEVKSLRNGDASIAEAFCTFVGNELVVRNMTIQPFEKAKNYGHEPKRDRKLLLHRTELRKLQRKLKDQGVTIVPVRVFFSEKGLAKLDIALAKGKKTYDKRDSIKERDVKRDMARGE